MCACLCACACVRVRALACMQGGVVGNAICGILHIENSSLNWSTEKKNTSSTIVAPVGELS